MKNFVESGHHIDITAPVGGATSGNGVVVGALFGIAASTAAAGESVALTTTGVFDLPKLGTAVIAAGARVAWDDALKHICLPGTDFYPVGVALAAAGNGVTTVRVRLDGTSTAAA